MVKFFGLLKLAVFAVMTAAVLLSPVSAMGKEWGKLMTAKEKTNIRERRTIDSRIAGQLQKDETVRAAYLKDGWYAVFAPETPKQPESKARGYVYAPRLIAVAVAVAGKKSPQKIEITKPQAPPASPEPAAGDKKQHVDITRLPAKSADLPAPAPSHSPSPLPQKTRETATVASAAEQTLTVMDISAKIEPDGREKVLIALSHDALPEIFGIDGQKPRIVIDLKNVRAVQKGVPRIKVEGKLIREIRSNLDHGAQRLRIVVDLAPSVSYEVEQVFYKEEKIFMIDISAAPANQKK